MHNQAIKYAPCGRRTSFHSAVYGGRYGYTGMKHFLTVLLCFLSAYVTAQEASCGNIDNVKAVRADNAAIKVAPRYPNQGTAKQTRGCAVITFSLVATPGTEGKALIPAELEVYLASEPRFGEAASAAVSEWRYSSKSIRAAQRYFTIIQFEVE